MDRVQAQIGTLDIAVIAAYLAIVLLTATKGSHRQSFTLYPLRVLSALQFLMKRS